MKKELELISELNEEYFNRTNDSLNQFYIEGNEFICLLKFNNIVLYDSESDSLMIDDKDCTIREFMIKSWQEYVQSTISLKPF